MSCLSLTICFHRDLYQQRMHRHPPPSLLPVSCVLPNSHHIDHDQRRMADVGESYRETISNARTDIPGLRGTNANQDSVSGLLTSPVDAIADILPLVAVQRQGSRRRESDKVSQALLREGGYGLLSSVYPIRCDSTPPCGIAGILDRCSHLPGRSPKGQPRRAETMDRAKSDGAYPD